MKSLLAIKVVLASTAWLTFLWSQPLAWSQEIAITGTKGPSSKADSDQPDRAQPNILLLFVDDLGWLDVGYRNAKFETPHIDQLVLDSLEFEQAYIASPTCSPSRATLLTGKHPARLQLVRHIPNDAKHGFDAWGRTDQLFHLWEKDPAQFPSRNWLPLEHTTYAEALKELGYHNHFFGKWHLGSERYHPIQQGFDRQTGTTNAGHPKSYTPKYFKNSDVFASETQKYLTDKLTDEAVDFIETYELNQPFMISMWYYNVHRPPVGRPDLVQYFVKKGYDKSAAIYAAQVKAVDESVGRLRAALKHAKIDQETVVIFLSDQGSWYDNSPLRGTKRVDALCEGGARVPLIIHWPGVTAAGAKNQSIVQSTDLFPTLVDIAGGIPSVHADLDGVSLKQTLQTNAQLERGRPVFGYRAYEDQYASVREGDWKLIAYRSGKRALYNIARDPSEEHDLAQSQATVLERLTASLVHWEQQMGVEDYSGVQ